MAEIVRRNLGPVRALDRGEYTLETASGRPAMCCKGCGTISEIGEAHRVLDGGMVSGVWDCPNPRCAFHDFLILTDVDEEVLA